MLGFIKNIFANDPLKEFAPLVEQIGALEPELQAKSDEELRHESLALKTRVQDLMREASDAGETDFDPFASASPHREELLTRAFALVREAARRTLKQRPFDVQLMGGMVLAGGGIAEMMTGEGKTLTAVAPLYVQSLKGKGAHLVTVNDYLARLGVVLMGQIYRLLGVSVSCIVPNNAYLYDPDWHVKEDEENSKPGGLDEARDTTGTFLVQQEFLRPITRREAYLADVTYGTNHEFGFDYLRDNLAYRFEDQVQRGHHFAIIDEADSILIDEARTPLIISAPDQESSEHYKTFARLAATLKRDEDFAVDEKRRGVAINESGIAKIEAKLGIQNLYAPENVRLVHYLEESLKAYALFHNDKEYVVKNGEVIIVDEFTGRMLQGRRYNGGLHQAIEAKEGVRVKEESRTYGKISIQNYFRMYRVISGMTGTAQTSAEEFHKVYQLEVVTIPTNKPMVRNDQSDLIYKSAEAKWRAVVNDIKERHEKGQPILVGTTSIEKNEHIASLLADAGIKHEMLNAKNNEREGAIIAQAGHVGAVTVATNVAGRGVDILLGGNPIVAVEAEKVRALGGLHVVGTERHEARRIDNQLRGRAGRQGDPGSSQFYLSLDDDLLRIFGGERIKAMMERFDVPEDQPIEVGFISKAVAQAQAKVEGANFDSRKHLLEYDDVLNRQRSAVYGKRKEILESVHKGELAKIIYDAASAHREILEASAAESPEAMYGGAPESSDAEASSAAALPAVLDDATVTKQSMEASMHPQALQAVLGILDGLWMTHLENLEALSDAVNLRSYGQKDPLAEYRGDARMMYDGFWANFNEGVYGTILKLGSQVTTQSGGGSIGVSTAGQRSALPIINQPMIPAAQSNSAPSGEFAKVGRNDPCPCGSGKKYKKCHGA
jgi:preprotein translocase subunit SecA